MRSTSRNASLSGKKNPIVIRYCAAQLCYDDWRNARNESQLQDKYEGITQDWTGDSCECSILCGHLCARIIISARSKSLRETFRPCIAYSIIGKVPLPILYFTYVGEQLTRDSTGRSAGVAQDREGGLVVGIVVALNVRGDSRWSLLHGCGYSYLPRFASLSPHACFQCKKAVSTKRRRCRTRAWFVVIKEASLSEFIRLHRARGITYFSSFPDSDLYLVRIHEGRKR